MSTIGHLAHAVALAAGLAALLWTSLAACRALQVRGTVRVLLTTAVLSCAQIVLAVEALSLVGRIGLGGLLAVHAATVAVLLAFGFRPLPLPFPAALRALRRVTGAPAPRVLAGLLAAAALVLACLVLRVPPTTHDGFTYHMTRAAMYLQQGSLAPFPTTDLRQTVFPANAEILALWQLALLRHDFTVGFVQLLGWLGLMVTAFAIARDAGLSEARAAFGALTTGALPLAVLQATSVQNDLLVAFFTAASLWLASRALAGSRTDALLAGLAWGLAIGTKPTAVLALPGVVLFLAARWRVLQPASWRPLVQLLLAAVTGFGLLGAHYYVQNVRLYGSPSGPRALRDLITAQDRPVPLVWSNLGRVTFRLFDPSGVAVPNSRAAVLLRRVHDAAQPRLFRALGIAESLPDDDFMHVGWQRFPGVGPHEDLATLGPLFGVLLLAATAWALFSPRVDRRLRCLAAGVALYLVALAVLLRYQHYHGRLFMGLLVFGGPLLALAYREGGGLVRSTANLLLVAACASSLLATTCYNERKKMTGPAAVIRPSDRVARMRLGRPHFEDAVRLLDALPPGRLAFVPADIESFTYPLFGAHLDRPVTIVHAGRLLRPLTPADLPDVEYVFFNGGAQSFLLDGAPAGPPWPWFGAADLRPLQEALRASGSDWQVVLESGGVGDAVLLFARTSRIGASAIERATRGAALAHERPGRNGM